MMPVFSQLLKNALSERGWSQNDLARHTNFDKGYISKILNGKLQPSENVARRTDEIMDTRGELIAAAHLDIAAARDTEPSYTSELLQRIHASDTSAPTLEALQATVIDLCCQYARQDATQLRAQCHTWLREITRLLKEPVGLKQHQDLLATAGWLALLVGCLEYDLGMRLSAEATRATAAQLANEAGASEILGWAYEMKAWFALTQGRLHDVLRASDAGIEVARNHAVTVQLVAQRAKALGRMGNIKGVHESLDKGRQLLDQLTFPGRQDNHFVVDPSKWDFYAMDVHRQARDDDRAGEYAHEVIRLSVTPSGEEVAPMRLSESRLTLAVTAARRGELEEAVGLGLDALRSNRRSLPSLLVVAGELDAELSARFPQNKATQEFQARLRLLR